MSETTDKPKLQPRAPLGLKRTVEVGKVKQSFSHGRSNTVIVETKRRAPCGAPATLRPKLRSPFSRRRLPPRLHALRSRRPRPSLFSVRPRMPPPAASCRTDCCARPKKRA
jgi:translation initiation factor IF-2